MRQVNTLREGEAVNNLDIRLLVSGNKLKYRDIADEMNISRQHLSRLMRNELTTANKIRIMAAIRRLRGDDIA